MLTAVLLSPILTMPSALRRIPMRMIPMHFVTVVNTMMLKLALSILGRGIMILLLVGLLAVIHMPEENLIR